MSQKAIQNLSNKQLLALERLVQEELAIRYSSDVKVGSIVSFKDKAGQERIGRITKISPRSCSCEETYTSKEPNLKWRLFKDLLVVQKVERTQEEINKIRGIEQIKPKIRRTSAPSCGVESAW